MNKLIYVFLALFSVKNSFGQSLDNNQLVYFYVEKSQKVDNTNFNESFSYLKKALLLRGLHDSSRIHLYSNVAAFYRQGGSYVMGLNYYLKELEVVKTFKPQKLFLVYNNIAGCYFELKNYEKSRIYFEKALKEYEQSLKFDIRKSQKLEGSLIYNNLAVLEMNQGNYVEAQLMLEKFKKQNESMKDTLNIILAYENLSDLFNKNRDYVSSIQYLRKGLELAKSVKSEYDVASLYTEIGQFFYQNKISEDSALFYFNKAYQISDKNDFIEIALNNVESLAKISKQKGEFKKALDYFEIVRTLSVKKTELENFQKLRMLESEQEEKKIQLQQSIQQEKREFFLIIGVVVLLLITSIVSLLLLLQNNISKRRKVEKELLSKELEIRKKEIKSSTLHIIQNTEMLKNTQRDLEDLKDKSDSDLNPSFRKIINNLKNNTQVFNKKEFEKLFIEVDGDFYKKLLERHPKLTKNEIRLCAFLKLNLTTKEISSITQQRTQTLVVARHRLRKKLGLEKGESIVVYLMSV